MFENIKLQAYALQPNLEIEVYRYEYPEQWIETFRAVNLTLGKEKRVLPFKQIKNFLLSWSTDILLVNDFSNTHFDKTWIIASQPINQDFLIGVFQSCLDVTIGQFQNLYAKEAFSNWVNQLELDSFLKPIKCKIKLTTEVQQIHDNQAFQIIPRLIYQQMASKKLEVDGQELTFIPSENGLVSEPKKLSYETKKIKNYYSIKIVANIQTTPHNRIPMLQFTFMITRWINKKVPLNRWNESNTSVYAQVENRLVKLEIVKKNKELYWEPIQKEMYQSIYFGQALPNVDDLVQNPSDFNQFHIMYRLEFGNSTFVGAGESMLDRYILNDWLVEELSSIIFPFLPLTKGKSIVGQVKKKNMKENLINPEKVRNILRTMIGKEKLNIEVYYMGEHESLIEPIKNMLTETLSIGEGDLKSQQLDIEVKYIKQNEILSQLDPQKTKKENHEEKIKQILHLIPRVTDVTACLVLLPYINEDGQRYYKEKEDPKKAIRAGFAITGRLTQFIDSTNPDSKNHRVETAIYDLLRQLGYVDPFESKKHRAISYNTAVSAMHIINFKKTPYGGTKRAMIWLVRHENQGPIMVECPALWKGQKYYWEACIAFQEVATEQGYRKFKPDRVIRDIKDRIFALTYAKDKPHLLMIYSDGVTRKEWPFLTDLNLSSITKKGPYTLSNLWFEKGKEKEGLALSEDNQLRILRVRVNNEVPDYLTPLNPKGNYQTKSGIFRFGEIFYSIADKPLNTEYSSAVYSKNSKLLKQGANKTFKFSNLVELYPVHLNLDDDPEEWVSLTHNYRNLAHQFKDTLKAPLLLHMAHQLEEYIY